MYVANLDSDPEVLKKMGLRRRPDHPGNNGRPDIRNEHAKHGDPHSLREFCSHICLSVGE